MTGAALHRRASRGLPRLPSALDVRIQRLGRAPPPGGALRSGRHVQTPTAGGVRPVGLRSPQADPGECRRTCTVGPTSRDLCRCSGGG